MRSVACGGIGSGAFVLFVQLGIGRGVVVLLYTPVFSLLQI